jgi:cytochrome c
MQFAGDGKRVYLEMDGLQKEHVVYFLLPQSLESATGQQLWSGEAWYTLNNIPDARTPL